MAVPPGGTWAKVEPELTRLYHSTGTGGVIFEQSYIELSKVEVTFVADGILNDALKPLVFDCAISP